MGQVSNSFMGRDDGYPEEKHQIVNSLEELVGSFDPKAKYFKLEIVKPEAIQAIVQAVKDFDK
jgi:hypothetical protein